MKKLQNDFTTPEQSKRLLAMGIPANTADLYYERHSDIKFERLNIRLNKIELADDFFEKHSLYTPHWSVGRLIKIYNMCVDFDLDDGAAIVIFIQDESPIVQMMQMLEDKVGIMDFSKLED